MQQLLNIPLHLKRVSTLPYKVLCHKFSVFCALGQSCWKINSPESWRLVSTSCSYNFEHESLANAKVSVRQQCVHKGP